jgi:hypothetical protein
LCETVPSFVLRLVCIRDERTESEAQTLLSTECRERRSKPMERYRLKTAALVILQENGHDVKGTLPAGALITLHNGTFGGQLVEVTWNGKKLMMFSHDLRSLGEAAD